MTMKILCLAFLLVEAQEPPAAGGPLAVQEAAEKAAAEMVAEKAEEEISKAEVELDKDEAAIFNDDAGTQARLDAVSSGEAVRKVKTPMLQKVSPAVLGGVEAEQSSSQSTGQLTGQSTSTMLNPNGLKCVSFRRTANCAPTGPRDPLNDLHCDLRVDSDVSGFCECESLQLTAATGCGHKPFTCTQKCNEMNRLWREVFNNQVASQLGPEQEELNAEDPYDAASKYGSEAVTAVNHAVRAARQTLDGAKDMIRRMMAAEPWKKISEAGKRAEKAGQDAQDAAKLARPFIYLQRH